MKIINVGLLGFGKGGMVHHEPMLTVVPGFKITKIFNISTNREYLAKKYPVSVVTENPDDIFQDDSIDLVVITTPNDTHFDFAKRALESGKNVVVDKPFTATAEQAKELIQIAKRNNKIISVHQNRRWDGDFKTVRSIVESGVLGKLVEVEFHYDLYLPFVNSETWREKNKSTGGLEYDVGSHIIDQMLQLFGKPRAVFGDMRIQRDNSRTIDSFEIILDYPEIKATLKSGALFKDSTPRYTLIGANGIFVKTGEDVQEPDLIKGLRPEKGQPWGVEDADNWGKINTTINGVHIVGRIETIPGDYREFYSNIYQALTAGESLKVTAEQAMDVIRVINLANESSKQKQWLDFTDI
jgi:predicted dehydrogenase